MSQTNVGAQLSDKEKTPTSSRWWEYYFVRYSFGTILGAGIVLLLSNRVEPLKGAVDALMKDPQLHGIANVTVLTAAGLAYCYIASAPMLALHTLRIHLFGFLGAKINFVDHSGHVNVSYGRSLWVPAVLLFVISGSSFGYLVWSGWAKATVQLLVLAAIALPQFLLLGLAHADRFGVLRSFYGALASARAGAESREYVESYRHMREHSNAYSIIVLELALAPALIETQTLGQITAVIVIWLLPAAYCWLIGGLLEINLASQPQSE